MKRLHQVFLASFLGLFACLVSSSKAADSPIKVNSAKPKPLHTILVDTQGKPVSGAEVEFWKNDLNLFPFNGMRVFSKTTTGVDGKLDIESETGGVVLIRKTGMPVIWKDIQWYTRPDDTNMVIPASSVLAGTIKDELDKPVAGAKVFVTAAYLRSQIQSHRVTGKPIEEALNATTDASGTFRIEGVPTNTTFALKVRAPGRVMRPDGLQFNINALPYTSGQQDISISLEPAGIIQGKIMTEDGSTPIPTATLQVLSLSRSFGGDAPDPVISSPDGTFQINNVPAGDYEINAVFGTNALPDWIATKEKIKVESGKTNSDIQIKAQHGVVTEIAVVTQGSLIPVEGMSLYIATTSFQRSKATDSNGVVNLRLPAGEYHVTTSAIDWKQANEPLKVETGKTNNLRIEVTPPQTITGIVRDPSGKPAPGLPVRFVSVYGRDMEKLTTDANGKFEFVRPEINSEELRNSTPCLFVQDVTNNLAVAATIEEDTKAFDLKLAPAITLKGHAECDGKIIENPVVSLIFWSGNNGMHLSDLSRKGASPGQYEIPALPAERKYGVLVSAKGYGQKPIYDATTTDTEAGTIELPSAEIRQANLKIAGKVVDGNDKAVANAWVNLWGDGQPSGSTQTDQEGRFTFDQVCEGQLRIYCSGGSDNSSGETATEGGDTNVIVKLGERTSNNVESSNKSHKLTGIVNGTNSQPVSGAMVIVMPQNGNQSWIKTDSNGVFSLTWRMEPWQLQSSNPYLIVRDKAHDLAAVQEITEDTTNLTVQLKPALSISGRVENEEKKSLAKAQVRIWFKAGNTMDSMEDTTTDEQGHFQIKCLPSDGSYTIYASANGYGTSQQPVKNDAGNSLEFPPIVLKQANQIIAGQVVNDEEKPMVNVNVNISGDNQPSDSIRTDRKGHFQFKVCPGKVYVFANANDIFAQTTADAGDTNIVVTLNRNFDSKPVQERKSLKGKPLPDLTRVGIDASAIPTNKAVLLCLFDAGQRPSRMLVRKLQEQAETLKEKGIVLAGIQVEPISDEDFKAWKEDNHITFAVGRVTNIKSEKWISAIENRPYLILADGQHQVISDGFPIDELEKRLNKMARIMAMKAKGPPPTAWAQSPAPIRPNAATLNGMVVPNGKPAKAWFAWGTTTNLEYTTPPQDVGNGSSVVRVRAPITGLTPGTVYHCRLIIATDSGITNQSPDRMFTTGLSVIAWGSKINGNCNVPAGLTNAVAIACGHGHSLALKNDGTVAFWGGEESYTAFHPNNIPQGLSNVVAVAGGYAQSFAVKEDGTVVAWGQYLNHVVPKVPANLSNVIAIAAGDQFALALKADGTVVTWGSQTSNNETKVPEGATNIVEITCGSRHGIALKADGSVLEWGDNYPALAPDELENVVAISGEAFRFLALQEDGQVFDWGGQGFQQLPPEGIKNAIAIGAGWKHSIAVNRDGTVTVWGNNEWHQMEVPKTLNSVISVAGGDVHCLALGKIDSSANSDTK